MRLATRTMQEMATHAMLAQQAKLNKTQLQMSTGQRLLTPSDDPAAAVSSLDLSDTLQINKQYQTNIGVVKDRLSFADSALDSAGQVLQRARELTVQGLNAPLNADDRKALGQEVQQLLDEVTGIANTRNANGEYIFAGHRTDTVPFGFSATQVPPSYTYRAENAQRQLQVADSRPMADGDSGFSVFENVPSTSGNQALAAAGGRQNILNTLLSLKQSLDGTFTGSHGAVLGGKDLSAGIDYSGGAKSFDITVENVVPAPVAVTIPAGNYNSADELAAAINTGINATALSGKVVAQTRAGYIEFAATQTGKASTVKISNDAAGVLTDLGLIDPTTGQGAEVPFNDAANAALKDLDAGIQHIADIRAGIGARLNALDTQDDLFSKFNIDTQASIADLTELDYTEAITRFTQQQTALQAAQQAYSRVQRLSLFEYL